MFTVQKLIKHFNYSDLSYNNITGSIPSSLAELASLQSVYVLLKERIQED